MNDLNFNYSSFKSITSSLNKKAVNKDFWEKERNNINERINKGKDVKKSMVMTTAKYYKTFCL